MKDGTVNILLTGATGYVGRRPLTALSGGPDVRLCLLVRSAAKMGAVPDSAEIVEGSPFDCEVINTASS